MRKINTFILSLALTVMCCGISHAYAHECALKGSPTSLNYEMFGAKSDNIYDDGIAIKKTHEEANYHKLPVIATASGKNYYIKGTKHIMIETNTDLKGANIYIDESNNTADNYTFRILSSGNVTYKSGSTELKEIQDILENGSSSKYISKYNNKLIVAKDENTIAFKRHEPTRDYVYREVFAVQSNKLIGEDRKSVV